MRYFLFMALCLPLAAQQMSVSTKQIDRNKLQQTLTEDSDRLILVKPKKDAPAEAIAAAVKRHGLKDKTKTKLLKWKQYEVPPGKSKAEVIRALRYGGPFEAVQENRTYSTQDSIPNDPFFSQLWGLTNISAPAGWDLTREAPNVIVAVVDTGIDFTHPDLVNNLWTGPNGEHGYSVLNGVVTEGGMDDHGHGSHCAGTIAGVGNNGIGVAGIAWKAKIMAMQVLHGGTGSSYDIAIGLEKLIELKQAGYPIVVSNHSYGAVGEDQIMQDAFGLLEQADIFVAAAAGNNNSDVDSQSFIPAVFPFGNIVSTMASDSGNLRAFFSNYGLVRCDIAAPGLGVLSCTRSNTYSSWSGTSMASPHVCGVALLVRARNPGLSARAVRDLILDPGSYDAFANLSNNNTSARLNLNKTIRNPRLFESPFRFNTAPTISAVTPYTVVSNATTISFQVTDPDNDSMRSSVAASGSIFANDFSGFFKNLTAKNGFSFRPGPGNSVIVSSQPFAYQLAGNLMALASDNRGGGDSAPTGFEVAKANSVRRPILIKTWTVRTNAQFGSISWTFDVVDDAKENYSYIFSWTKGHGTGSWFGFQPGPIENTANINIDTSKFSVRVFVMDKFLNWRNAEPLYVPANSVSFPHCNATASAIEGNAPFETVFDLSASTGPITHRLVTDFFLGGSSPNAALITNVFTEPIVKFARPIVLSTVTGESDSMIIPIFSSRFASLTVSNPPPTEPPHAITNLVAVTNLNATWSGNTTLLRWTDRSKNEDRYVVEASYQSKSYHSPWFVVGTLGPDQEFFVHVPTERKATWTYRVKACGGVLCSPYSNLASVRVR